MCDLLAEHYQRILAEQRAAVGDVPERLRAVGLGGELWDDGWYLWVDGDDGDETWGPFDTSDVEVLLAQVTSS